MNINQLSAWEWDKCQSGLKIELRKLATLPDMPVSILDKRDQLAADIWIKLIDGKIYYITGSDLPETWSKADWEDFVVRLAKGSDVKQLGIIREWPLGEAPIVPPWGWRRIKSPEEMLLLAGTIATPPLGDGEEVMVGLGTINWPIVFALGGIGLVLLTVIIKKGGR